MWKYLNESVEGTSHRDGATGCQDSSFVTPFKIEGDDVLILACADGAGSAAESALGSRVACETVTQLAVSFLESGRKPGDILDDEVRRWFGAVQDALNAEAERENLSARDLACTLLLSIVSNSASAFAQIGDGAIVILEDGEYRPVFWPEHGEYQNATYFITERDCATHVQIRCSQVGISELAMFSDGLQMLALNYAAKTAHQPFFTPMFHALRAAADQQDLIAPLRSFLDSRAVNDRTDDDKTLILASRVPRGDATV